MATLISASTVVADLSSDVAVDITAASTALATGEVALVIWTWLITPEWVRQQAYAYAESLLAAAELLGKPALEPTPAALSEDPAS